MIPQRCIIVASGASVRQGMWNTQVKDLPLWNHLDSEFILGANWLFKYYIPTALLYIDHQFYIREKDNLASLPLVFGLQNGYYSRAKIVKSIQFDTYYLHDNIYLLPHRKKEEIDDKVVQYHSINSWKKGFVAGLTGIMSLNFAIACGCQDIFLLGMDATETNGRTHFYEDEMLPTGKNEDGGDSDSGIGKDKNGNFKTSIYNGGFKERFDVFKDELKRINIYNVSLNSKIDTFPKISYEEFYKQLKKNPLHLSQDDIRKSILKIYNENYLK